MLLEEGGLIVVTRHDPSSAGQHLDAARLEAVGVCGIDDDLDRIGLHPRVGGLEVSFQSAARVVVESECGGHLVYLGAGGHGQIDPQERLGTRPAVEPRLEIDQLVAPIGAGDECGCGHAVLVVQPTGQLRAGGSATAQAAPARLAVADLEQRPQVGEQHPVVATHSPGSQAAGADEATHVLRVEAQDQAG